MWGRVQDAHSQHSKTHTTQQDHDNWTHTTLTQQDHDNSCNWVHKTGYVTHNTARPWQDKNTQAKDHTQHSKIHTGYVTKLSFTLLILCF